MLIAQISDTHIKPKGELAMGWVDTARHLARAMAHINALRPPPEGLSRCPRDPKI